MSVPDTARVKSDGSVGQVLATLSTLPGVPAEAGVRWVVLLFPDGEAKYFRRDAVDVEDWREV